jgi:hypothetical protein
MDRKTEQHGEVFSGQIVIKIPKIGIFMRIGPVGADLFHVNRETDRKTEQHGEDNNRFRNFANALRKDNRITDSNT